LTNRDVGDSALMSRFENHEIVVDAVSEQNISERGGARCIPVPVGAAARRSA